MESVDQVSVDIDALHRLVQDLETDSSPHCCIFKLNHKCVLRACVGLGLFHHEDSSDTVKKIKENAIRETARWIDNMNENTLIEHVKVLLGRIKDCYEKSSAYFTDVSEFDQAKYFALDACFIIKLFIIDWQRGDDKWTTGMTADIFMFQNQIPLFLLLEIMKLKYGSMETVADVFSKRLTRCRPFQTLHPFAISPPEKIINEVLKEALMESTETKQCYHLLHLLNKCIIHFLSPDPNLRTIAGTTTPILRHQQLEKLHTFNIKFQASWDNKVWFKKRWLLSSILCLPQITLDDATESLQRSLMNFARLPHQDRLICDLMFIMECIVSETSQEHFREAGIIQGNGKDFFERISRLCKGVTSCVGQYGWLIKQLDEHCRDPLNRWIYNTWGFVCRHASLAVAVSIVLGVMSYTKT